MIIVFIGPMGCGKSTVGRLLAERVGWDFDDGDDFHPPQNIAKMQKGIPLTDEDRAGWLEILSGRIEEKKKHRENLVMACSALKRKYRMVLGIDQVGVVSVYLKGSKRLLQQRIASRNHQFMNDELLSSQLATMEEPEDGLTVDIQKPPEALIESIITQLQLEK